jgi:hypothetical protein
LDKRIFFFFLFAFASLSSLPSFHPTIVLAIHSLALTSSTPFPSTHPFFLPTATQQQQQQHITSTHTHPSLLSFIPVSQFIVLGEC